MLNRGDPLSRVRTKSFLAVCLVGALAGVVSGLHGKGDMGVFLYGFSGAVSVLITASAGGFMGMFLRNAILFFRGGRAEEGGTNTDGIFPASSFGALVGLVVVLVAGDWGGAYYGAVVGAFFGGILGVLPGEAVGVLLRMLAFEERGGEEERTADVPEEEIQMSGEDLVEPEEKIMGLRELQQSEGRAEGRAEEQGQKAEEEPGGPSEDVSKEGEDPGRPGEDVPEDKKE
ncbi:MAG: hypothetical protein SVS15_04770 [Thermodesulfobacteriota bacterium]|nr:hypothetical protein [Thermodesulfobacteriota bacterium]